ncbi:hypothetical protein L7F22_056169 [Adiantum nelumboides]|nr:hypothetical protein [Adiantum nelumboides]
MAKSTKSVSDEESNYTQNLENQLEVEKFANGELLETLITHIKNLQDQMTAAGMGLNHKISHKDAIVSYPQKNKGLVTSLNKEMRVPPLSFEEFCTILQEEQMQQRLWWDRDTAFIATAKGKERTTGGASSSSLEASLCGLCMDSLDTGLHTYVDYA